MATKNPPRRAAADAAAPTPPAVPPDRNPSDSEPLIIYIHGIGAQPPEDTLKAKWDLALFGKDMGDRTRMAYWADILDKATPPPKRPRGLTGSDGVDVSKLLQEAGVKNKEEATRLAGALLRAAGVAPEGISEKSVRKKILPLPAALRKPLAKAFLEAFIKDTAAYFFRPGAQPAIDQRLIAALPKDGRPVVLVSHSQGTIVAFNVLSSLPPKSAADIQQLVTLGSPLGIQEVQDLLARLPGSRGLEIPGRIVRWANFADPLDPVAIQKGISNDFEPPGFIVDSLIVNTQLRSLRFDPHSGVGYLAHPKVRSLVCRAARVDPQARFLVARDVAENLAVSGRHSVLIEVLEPGYAAVDELPQELAQKEMDETSDGEPITLARRVQNAAAVITRIIETVSPGHVEEASIDPLRRFVAARLTPEELMAVAKRHAGIRIYAVWKSNVKRRLIHRSHRVVHADAARVSYRATGKDIRWAVLDTGVRWSHPHFQTNNTIEQVWDCTKKGRPQAAPHNVRDADGHGTHVCGIVAGSSPDGLLQGIAPEARLMVYKVLADNGDGEDAWIIKALDHIAEQNENNSEIYIHGINLSLGGPYDSTVYGCGFSPICVELRRAWRSGVVVVVASGNEGQVQVNTPDGNLDLNSPMSIGDPANLEECIAVGSVNSDRPHLYGVSAFSSRGPTSDGRHKPDVVAPGERITSCNSNLPANPIQAPRQRLYRVDSGTSMAAPHVSGLLAAFLSVRKEFRGRPDEVKELLLRTCTDIGRDRYHQGRGIPNLMRMLLEA